jgi:hypothetical protein
MINRIIGTTTGIALAFTWAANTIPASRVAGLDGFLFVLAGAAVGYLLGRIADGVSRL